jgi:hypothetical protein
MTVPLRYVCVRQRAGACASPPPTSGTHTHTHTHTHTSLIRHQRRTTEASDRLDHTRTFETWANCTRHAHACVPCVRIPLRIAPRASRALLLVTMLAPADSCAWSTLQLRGNEVCVCCACVVCVRVCVCDSVFVKALRSYFRSVGVSFGGAVAWRAKRAAILREKCENWQIFALSRQKLSKTLVCVCVSDFL